MVQTDRLRVVLGIAALDGVCAHRLDARVGRRNVEGSHLAVCQFRDMGWAGGGDLVEAVRAVDDPDLFGAEFLQDVGEGFDPVLREYAEQEP